MTEISPTGSLVDGAAIVARLTTVAFSLCAAFGPMLSHPPC